MVTNLNHWAYCLIVSHYNRLFETIQKRIQLLSLLFISTAAFTPADARKVYRVIDGETFFLKATFLFYLNRYDI